jgi:hypothetical protein
VQLSGGDVGSDDEAPVVPPTPGPVPPDTGVPPEQLVMVSGWQVKPAPQSAAALQGSCQWNAQNELVLVVQVASLVTGLLSHFVFGSQGGAVEPAPEHSE